MTVHEIRNILEERPEFSLIYPVHSLREVEGKLLFNSYIACPIIINNSYDKNNVIDIKNDTREVLGSIFFANNAALIDREDMTEDRFAAYLADVNKDDFLAEVDYVLKADYLVLKAHQYHEYQEKYRNTSGLWGGFIHKDEDNFPSLPFTSVVTEITAIDNLELPTIWHKENLIRGIQQPYAFERFLKNYHLLELLFDWQIIQKIKGLNDDIYGAGLILKSYGKGEEIDRLIDCVENGVKNIGQIVTQLNQIQHFTSEAINIFYIYGKADSNPLKTSREDFTNPSKFEAIINNGGFGMDNVKKLNNIQTSDYNKFIIKLSCYWIYRIRSSIAHAKIGEYQLSYQNEQFMVEFAEPLLKEILVQCFTNTPVTPVHSA